MAKASARKALNKPAKLGGLPEWNLNDLYPGLDSPEVKRDLELADSECAAFEQDFKGRLAALAAGGGGALRKPWRATKRSTTGLAGCCPMHR